MDPPPDPSALSAPSSGLLTHHTPPPPYPFSASDCTLITQGAEALLYRTHFTTTPSSPSEPSTSIQAALKVRPSKPYRHEVLDKRLTRQRVLAEARVLIKLSALAGNGDAQDGPDVGVRVPEVLGIEYDVGRRVKGLPAGARGLNPNPPQSRVDSAQSNGDTLTADSSSTTDTTISATPTNTPTLTSPAKSSQGGSWLLMTWISGSTVKDLLRAWDRWYKHPSTTDTSRSEGEEDVKKLLRRVGRAVAVMHDKGGVVHGDLTSSNIMIRPYGDDSTSSGVNGTHTESNGGAHPTNLNSNTETNGTPEANSTPTPSMTAMEQTSPHSQTLPHPPNLNGEITLIDFGLSQQSLQDEDRAVDLYVLERAFGSTHPMQEGWFDAEVLQSDEGYRGMFPGAKVVLRRLEDVRMRGRKRSMVG